MKTSFCLLLVMGIFFLLLPSCKKDCPGGSLSISAVEPPSNPPDYEVRLKGTGFNAASIVRFDNSESSDTRFIDESTLIATIPAGILGPVEVSVADGDCIARNDRFEVFADFPSNIPINPNTIIIPQVASVYPTNGFQNCWSNIRDTNHCLQLDPDLNLSNGHLDASSYESNFGNELLNNNKITGYIRFDEAAKTSDIQIQIDRTKNAGGEVEGYTGVFIDPASVGSENAFAILFTSEKDGRQLVVKFGQ